VKRLKKKIHVELLEEASEYYLGLPKKIQEKFLKSFDKTQLGFKGIWFEKIESKHGIFEFRERDSEKFYRIFAFWNSDNDAKTLILGTHGFDKKTNKTPISEIERAINIKKSYFQSKSNKK
jgi:phage-related protein